MSTNENEVMEERIDIDLSGIDQPNLTREPGNGQVTLVDITLKKSKTDRPMIECHYETVHPETQEIIRIRDYPLLDAQPGKYRLRQLVYARGYDDATWDKNVKSLIGASCQAEIGKETSEEYGDQNKINRLLQEVPKRA